MNFSVPKGSETIEFRLSYLRPVPQEIRDDIPQEIRDDMLEPGLPQYPVVYCFLLRIGNLSSVVNVIVLSCRWKNFANAAYSSPPETTRHKDPGRFAFVDDIRSEPVIDDRFYCFLHKKNELSCTERLGNNRIRVQ